MWRLLILHDDWQGEIGVALFGGSGWAFLALVSRMWGDSATFVMPQFRVVTDVAPSFCWELWFFLFGTAQLVGWGMRWRWLRVAGATGMFLGLVTVFTGVALIGPISYGLSMYLVCIFVEFCAIIYQTACIVRYREWPPWRLTTKP